MLECDIYPVYITGKGNVRAAKEKVSREAQHNLNHRNAQKKVTRLIHANFNRRDVWADFTYEDDSLPTNENEAKKDMQNYIRRLKGYVKRNCPTSPPFKYIYVTEYTDIDGETVRTHHHLIINFHDRDVLEELWLKGGRMRTRRLQPDDYGFEGLARYITKAPRENSETGKLGIKKYSKRYTASTNLTKPKITTADTKISKSRAAGLAKNPGMANELFQRLYKGYVFNDMETKYSQYVSGVYLYVRMRRNSNKGGGG